MKFKKGDRVKAIAEYAVFDDVPDETDVIRVGMTGTVTDDDSIAPSVKWDSLPNSPDWCMLTCELEIIN